MEQYTAGNVEMAVLQFYYQGASQETHKWLTNAQMSTAAWNFAWDLLLPEKKPEVQFFGASTIAIKVSKFWQEVPNDQVVALRNRIIQTLMSYKGLRIVQTRLCIAMASVVIQTIPEHWKSPIMEIMNILQGNSTLLFEVLTVVPEEFSTQAMPSTKRALVRNELSNSLAQVLPLISQVLQQPSQGEVTVQAIKCLQAWVQFGIPMEQTAPIVERLLLSVQDEELFDCSLDALSSIISHPDTHKYVNLLKSFLQQILGLEPFLTQLLNEGSYEMATPLVSLFVTFGETHSRMLIDWSTENEAGRNATVRLVRIILSISSVRAQFPTQETISEIPFGFWYIFQDDMIACEPPQFQITIATFGPIYEELVNALISKAMYSLAENEWTGDQRETFRCYRTDIADTIMYCYNILRDNLLRLLLRHVDEATSKNLQDPASQWPYLECVLYSWSAVAESLAEEEDVASELLTKFLAKLPVLPYNNNMRVISSALDCIGGFAEWLAMHPDLLPHVTPIVLTGLQSQEVALYATMALKDMSRDCAVGMKPYGEEILTACHNALKSGQLKQGECVRLFYPMGKMLSLLPPPTILPRLEPILTPYLSEMQETAGQAPSPQTKAKISFHLKILMTLFQTLDIRRRDEEAAEAQQSKLDYPQPISVIFPQIYPLLKRVAEVWIKDSDVMDTLCSVLRQVVATLLDDIKPFSQDIIMLLIQCYTTEPHPSTLELARQFFVMYGNDQAMQSMLKSFLKQLVDQTLKAMQSSPNPSDCADLIATFFQVLAQILKKSPVLLADENSGIDLAQLFQCACGCLGFPENGPVKYACSFLSNFVSVGRDHPAFNMVVMRHGQVLFMNTMTCIGGQSSAISSSFTDHYVDVLFALNKKYFDNLCQWLTTLVNTEGFPTAIVNKEQKQQFASLVLKERANKRKLQEIVREFSLACSGLAGTQQAVQMAQVLAAWDRVGDKPKKT